MSISTMSCFPTDDGSSANGLSERNSAFSTTRVLSGNTELIFVPLARNTAVLPPRRDTMPLRLIRRETEREKEGEGEREREGELIHCDIFQFTSR